MAYDNLTDKQRRFCEEYVIDWNATRAAIAAGYSEKTAQVIGSENLSKPIISEYIEEVQKDLGKLCGVSAARNVLELKKIAYGNLSDFKDGWLTQKDFEELTRDEKACLSEIQYTIKKFDWGDETIVKFKVHDKQRAIEIINKMLGYNAVVKSEVDINNPLTEDERIARLAVLKGKLKSDE